MRDKRRKAPGISLSAAGRHTRLAPGHAGTGKAGTPFWRRTDRHNAPRKAPLWSALSSLLLLWLGVGGTVFAVITGFGYFLLHSNKKYLKGRRAEKTACGYF